MNFVGLGGGRRQEEGAIFLDSIVAECSRTDPGGQPVTVGFVRVCVCVYAQVFSNAQCRKFTLRLNLESKYKMLRGRDCERSAVNTTPGTRG